jgi:hypothetical protein
MKGKSVGWHEIASDNTPETELSVELANQSGGTNWRLGGKLGKI